MEALSVVPSIISKSNYMQFISVFQNMIDDNDTLAAPYIAYNMYYVAPLNTTVAHSMLINLVKNYGNNKYVSDAVISNLQNKEDGFYKEALAINPDTSLVFNKHLHKVIEDVTKAKSQSNQKKIAAMYPRGAEIFNSLCQACHGPDGNGVSALAPPLNKSNWAQGNKNQLIPIVLFGLTGPIKVADHLYKSPEVNGDMPGIGANAEFSDKDIADILNYIRNSWNNSGSKITEQDIKDTRQKYNGREKTMTMEELETIQ